mmetsp:Transcript_116000/g.369008  ORF Transcript_116000/g.369008 Transcript_116000/m.369008 type:complete len:364 (-) Transcript_116000:22-1113(-)
MGKVLKGFGQGRGNVRVFGERYQGFLVQLGKLRLAFGIPLHPAVLLGDEHPSCKELSQVRQDKAHLVVCPRRTRPLHRIHQIRPRRHQRQAFRRRQRAAAVSDVQRDGQRDVRAGALAADDDVRSRPGAACDTVVAGVGVAVGSCVSSTGLAILHHPLVHLDAVFMRSAQRELWASPVVRRQHGDLPSLRDLRGQLDVRLRRTEAECSTVHVEALRRHQLRALEGGGPVPEASDVAYFHLLDRDVPGHQRPRHEARSVGQHPQQLQVPRTSLRQRAHVELNQVPPQAPSLPPRRGQAAGQAGCLLPHPLTGLLRHLGHLAKKLADHLVKTGGRLLDDFMLLLVLRGCNRSPGRHRGFVWASVA